MAVPLVASRGSIRRLGRFLLAMAQERAREKGLEVQVIIREGKTREEIKAAAKELQVSLEEGSQALHIFTARLRGGKDARRLGETRAARGGLGSRKESSVHWSGV